MYQLTLAERDLYLVHIETQMEQKRRMLLEKQKEDQIRAMNYLNQYIDEIIVNGKLTDIDLENAKMEQDELIQEMAQIKSGLDEIIQLQEDAGNANEGI
jgi:intracellular sulfur oxidation DsrE/DsrF family protein